MILRKKKKKLKVQLHISFQMSQSVALSKIECESRVSSCNFEEPE